MDGGDCDWWIQWPRLQWNQLMPFAFSASWEWDNRLVAPPSPTPCWGHKSDRHQWKTAVKTRLRDRRATVMTEWGQQDLYQSRCRLDSSWIMAMETRLWVFVSYQINNYISYNFAGLGCTNQQINSNQSKRRTGTFSLASLTVVYHIIRKGINHLFYGNLQW